MKLNLLYFCLGFYLIVTGCRKTNRCNPDYNFEVPITLSSYDPTFNIGDTLTLKMNVDNTMLKDKEGNRTIAYPNFNPFLYLTIIGLDSLPVNDVIANMEVIIKNEYVISYSQLDSTVQIINFDSIVTSETQSELEIAFVFLEKGTFALLLGSYLSLGNSNIPGRCVPTQGISLEPADLGTSVETTFIIPEESIVNEEILSSLNLEVLNNYFNFSLGESSQSRFYFAVK